GRRTNSTPTPASHRAKSASTSSATTVSLAADCASRRALAKASAPPPAITTARFSTRTKTGNVASFCVSAGPVRGVLYGSANCRGPRLQSEETGSRGGAPREIGFLRRPALAQRKSTRGQAYPVLARNKRL